MIEKNLFKFEHNENQLIVSYNSKLFIQLQLEMPNKFKIDEIINRLCYELENQEANNNNNNNNESLAKLRIFSKYYIMSNCLFKQELDDFIKEKTQAYYDCLASNALSSFKNKQSNQAWVIINFFLINIRVKMKFFLCNYEKL